MNNAIQSLPLAQVTLSGTNPRKHFDGPAMTELQESIRTHGVVQPILVRPGKKDKYLLVSGERRWRAAKAVGLTEIPVLVRELDDKAALEIQVIENLQRADLHPLEEAEGYEKLLHSHGYTADELAAKVGKSKAYIYARLKLTALCPEARAALWAGKVNHSVALLIARIPDPKLQQKALAEVGPTRYRDAMPEKEAREHIHRQFMLRLKDAPFDTHDPQLVPAAGACATCPKRTGNQKELFPDVQSADTCTDPACFARKKEAAVAARLAAAAQDGRPVLAPSEAKRVFNRWGELSTKDFVELNDRCQDLGYSWGKDWKQTLGKACPTPTLAVDAKGELHELLPASEARAALKATGHKPKKREPAYRQSADYKAREKKKQQFRHAATLATHAILPKLLPALLKPKDRQHAKLWALLARAAYDAASIDENAFVAERRGLVKSQAQAEAALEKFLKTTTQSAALMEFCLELLLCAHWNNHYWATTTAWSKGFKAVAALAKVNLNRFLRQAAVQPKKAKKK